MSNSRPNRIYIFDQPRTCSMLFHRLLSKHPQLGHIFHPFSAAAMYGPGRIHLLLKPHDPASDAQQDKLAQDAAVNGVTYAGSENELYENIENLERDGKFICLKDHLVCLVRPELLLSHGKEWNGNENPTRRFSEDFLLNITHPIFLVRHPALMVRSFWESQQTVFKLRADDDLFMALTTLRWTSILYDWYVTHGIRPLVIDAYDTVYNTAAVMDLVCNAVGIDPKGIQYEWPAKDDVDWQDGHMSRMFMWKLQTSTVCRGKITARGRMWLMWRAKSPSGRQPGEKTLPIC